METRSQTDIWLIGPETESLTGRRLPSKKEVLQVFFFMKKTNSVKISAKLVTDQLLDFWHRARIPTKQPYHIVSHVEKLFDKYCKLKKNRGRDTEKQKINEAEFTQEIEELFDMAHEDAMTMITIDEDKVFL